ncbi:YraN family protein [Desulfolutivibrio sp.]|uniref:YraN family protein n=1 Tax=Desulfolutivibrio sp. TaxID=2773296 RepID=UPI002F96B33E
MTTDAAHLATGRRGEDLAADHLAAAGYRILARNWRCRAGEVDFICAFGDTLVFVEVKTRAVSPQADPAGAVTASKRSRIIKAASAYLTAKDLWDTPCRFDVVAIIESPHGTDIRRFENAFDASEVSGTSGRLYQPF